MNETAIDCHNFPRPKLRQANPIVVFVGQTLRVTNNDTIPHAIHTNVGVPFAHGADIQPGQSVNHNVTTVYSSDPPNGPIYDHSRGQETDIFIYSLDGNALYATNCASCHGVLSASTKRGRTAQQITDAITRIDDMRNSQMPNLSALTDRQKAAIAFALRLGSN